MLRDSPKIITLSWVPNLEIAGDHYSKSFGGPWAAGPETVHLTIATVPSSIHQTVEAAVMDSLVPEIGDWLCQAAVAPDGWRLLRHDLEWSWIDGSIVRTKDAEGASWR